MDQPPWGMQEVQVDPKKVRRALKIGKILVGLIVLIAVALSILVPYTNFLWYVHDVRQPQVFTTAYSTKGLLFLPAFFISWAVLYFNLRQALSLSLIYLSSPDSLGRALISQTMKWVQDRGLTVVKVGSPVIAFLASLSFSNEWMTFLLWRNYQSFGVTEPMFGIDVGFFIFVLPWIRAVTNYLLILLVLTTILSVGLYVGLQALAMLAQIELNRPRFRRHVSLLIGTTLIALAIQLWVKSYEFVLADVAQFTGAGYVESRVMVVQRALAILIGLIGATTVALPNRGKPYSVPMAGGILIGVAWIGGMLIYPVIIKRLVVDPDRLEKEGPYAARAIKMTRFAYGLDRIDVREVNVQGEPTQAAVQGASVTLDNMRLWDPSVLKTYLESFQAIRPYYEFNDVDLDRYTLNGRQTMVMLAPRDIQLDGLEPSARNWTNLRLRYTHGYGVTVTRVDRVTTDGRPVFLAQDIPLRQDPELKIDQPRIYFSDWRNALGRPTSEYALVSTNEPELDYEFPGGAGAETHKWTGTTGIPVGGLLAKTAFSITLSDGNLLVSPNVRGNAKLLMRRNVLERAKFVFPFLEFDSDPYLVAHNGRLLWILDGYSISNNAPYSSRYLGIINYIRNSVKATIDAYTGETIGYAVEPDEPLLRAFRKIYPGLIQDLSKAPEGLSAHFRYPEDLLRSQAVQLQTYHVTDPTTFLSNSDAWNIAVERSLNGQKAPISPYYVQMQLPDEPKAGFLQILPFTPNRRGNMSGWMAAHCDPGDYGRLTLYKFTGTTPIKGPELMESDFNATPQISEINRLFNNDQSVVIPGNLLVVPIGNSVMFVEPLFLQSRTEGIQRAPRLSWVVLALNERVVVGETYQDALQRLFGGQTTTQPSEPQTPGPAGERPPVSAPQDQAGAREALELLRQSEAAMKQGDWAKYGELQRQLRQKLEELVKQQSQ